MPENQPLQNGAKDFDSDLGVADRVGYDPQTETYHARHDWESDESLPLTVIETIAVAMGVSPEAMDHSIP